MMEDRGHDGYRGDLNRRAVTIAEALKPSGYAAYAVGKWHVTPGQTAANLGRTHNWPLQRGFDRFYGTIHGAGSFYDPSSLVRDNQLITAFNDSGYQPREYYYTDAISDHATRFIAEHKEAQREAAGADNRSSCTSLHRRALADARLDKEFAKYRGNTTQVYGCAPGAYEKRSGSD